MNTISGPRDLANTYGCSTVILDFHTGFPKDVILTRYKKDYFKIWICPHIYSLYTEWKIMQPYGQIRVSDLKNLLDPIHNKYFKIYDKFNRLVDGTLLEENNGWIGIPEFSDVNIWYDKNLVISV